MRRTGATAPHAASRGRGFSGLMSPAGDDVLAGLSGRAWQEIQGRAQDVAACLSTRV
ncbi:hypothetical protein [Streptomyces sp. NPDC018347]|uniref:hypothetical protein n=1 Tax=Streptomyces sp. NPDC018347 TaxID=3157193 RepID=UPI003409B480